MSGIKGKSDLDADEDALLQRWTGSVGVENVGDHSGVILFESDKEREEREARQLRDQRRKRLQAVTPNRLTDASPQKPSITTETSIQSKRIRTGAVSDAAVSEYQPPQTISKDTETDAMDMFSAAYNDTSTNTAESPRFNIKSLHGNPLNRTNAQDLDDAEGYYKASIGEILSFTRDADETHDKTCLYFKVLGVIGKGVFSTVLKCVRVFNDAAPASNLNDNNVLSTSTPDVVAIKLIRNNETMTKAAHKEAKILRVLRSTKSKIKKNHSVISNQTNASNTSDQTFQDQQLENHNIVKMLEWDDFFPHLPSSSSSSITTSHYIPLFEYNFHTVLFFEHLSINLRELLAKFGKNVGINLSAVRSYAKQLFSALDHLQSLGIIHADIKPDNILVSHTFQQVKLCDFGSAFFEADPLEKELLTPYLVSRFYRAPEIILGLEYDPAIDVWSLAATLGELFTGQVVFPGRTNNDMLSRFMETLGPFSNRMIKRHILSYTGKFNRAPHFEDMSSGGTFAFRRQDVDDFTGGPVVRIVTVGDATATAGNEKSLAQILLRAKSKSDGRVEVLHFADFLHRCLALDPGKRPKVDVALKHEFISRKKV